MLFFSNPMTENDVLRKLKIQDFRHLSKDKIMMFVSYLDKMEPEVAKKALEQIPEYALTIRETLKNLQEIIDKSIKSNDESVRYFYELANEDTAILRRQLETAGSYEERKNINEDLMRILRMVSEKDSENKKHLRENILIYCGFGFCGLVLLGRAFGVGDTFVASQTK